MSEQVRAEHNDQEPTSSGLLVSVESLQGRAQYLAAHTDDTDTDSGEEGDHYPGDTEDASDDESDATDADGSDDSDDTDNE
jgi:hypothetical protein